jgi:hypothetical protein
VSKARDPKSDGEGAGGVTQEDLLHWVWSFVWSGENDAEEVALMIEDQLGEKDEVDEDWLRKAIRREFAAKRKAEKTWPKVTDCDLLDRAFDALEGQGVISLHIAGFTQSEGLWEVEQEYRDAGGEKSSYAGHCFYTEQDLESALHGGGLWIGYGHLSGNDARGVEVGLLVRSALEIEGLKVNWDGTIGRRLFLEGFRYQRRSPRLKERTVPRWIVSAPNRASGPHVSCDVRRCGALAILMARYQGLRDSGMHRRNGDEHVHVL